MSRNLTYDDYKVGWICALPIEVAAATAMMDERYPSLPSRSGANNIYEFGRIGNHNVVIAGLPAGYYDPINANRVAVEMKETFGSIRIGLLVGIAGGIPGPNRDIRLGDVIVSKPASGHGGVVRYNFGKALPNGRLQPTGFLNAPPKLLMTALTMLQAKDESSDYEFTRYLSPTPPPLQSNYDYPGVDLDRLFEWKYSHIGTDGDGCQKCDISRLVKRSERTPPYPKVHYGNIASGTEVISDVSIRDRLRNELDVLCFETEAAGLLDDFPCIVIRGISDYSDSHKNKIWYRWAALTSAAYAKEFLSIIPVEHVPYLYPVAASSPSESFLAFSRHLAPRNGVALGQLTIDTVTPWIDYCPYESDLTGADVAITPQRRVRELVDSAGRGSVLYNELTEALHTIINERDILESDSLTAEKSYLLLNSSHYFRRICKQPIVREWLQTTISMDWGVYMIVGIQTVPQGNSWSVLNTGNISPNQNPLANIATGEEIIAVQYRKVHFRWSTVKDEPGFLEMNHRWMVFEFGRGDQ